MFSEKLTDILIIDDDICVIKSIIRALKKPQYRFNYTIYPEEGLNLINKKEFDIVICDQMMPEINGLDILKYLKNKSPNTVRILMTGYSDINTVICCINEGSIYKYIAKPWSNEELEKIILEAIEYKESQEKNYREIINGLLRIMKVRDKEISEHCQQVSKYSMMLADDLKLPETKKPILKYAGLFHDIGKIAIREDILYKPSKLEEEEFNLIKDHSLIGADILSEFDFMKDISVIVSQHHEKINGKGYPFGLKGHEILLEAKILSVADCYDALTSNRIYRKSMDAREAINILLEEANESYDKDLVNRFAKIMLSDCEKNIV